MAVFTYHAVSDGDHFSQKGETVSPGDEKEETVFVGVAELRPFADPELANFPFTMKHVILMNDGTTVSTVPAESSLSDGSVFNLSGGNSLNITSVPRTEETTSGTLSQGMDMQLYFHGGLANLTESNVKDFVGEVILHLSDGSDFTWNSSDSKYTTVSGLYEHRFTFKWSDVQSQLDATGATVISADINVVYGLKAPIYFTVIRHNSGSDIRLASINPGKISNRLFARDVYDKFGTISGDRSINYENMKTGISEMRFSGTDATVPGAAMADEKFYLYESGTGLPIKSVTAKTGASDVTSQNVSYDSDSGRYIITMKQGMVINVTSEPETVHKVTVRNTSDDFSLHSVAVYDRFDGGKTDWYTEEAKNLRYANSSCTDVLSNGNAYARVKGNGYTSSDGKTVSFANYHKNDNINWYMSLIAYGTTPDSNPTSNANYEQFTEIYDTVITRDSDGTDVTGQLDVHYGTRTGNAYLRFKPPAYDVTVSFKTRQKLKMRHIYVNDVRPTLLDSVMVHYFYPSTDSPLLIPGNEDDLPKMQRDTSYDSLKKDYPPGNNAYYFPEDKKNLITDIGLFEVNKTYHYRCKSINGVADKSTMIASWKVYEADANGNKTGDPITFDITYTGDTEADYVKYIETDVTPGVGVYLPFKMPDKDIVIEACYTKTVGACLVKQQIANPDGTISGADNGFSVTFAGTPRDSQTHAFYNADSITLTGAKNGLGLYSGTKDVVMTVAPKEGYVISSVKFVPKVNPNTDHSSKLIRSGNVFTVPNSVIENRWTGPNAGNGVSYYITVTYTKANTLTVKQSVDGEILAGSSATMAKLTLESRNEGTFIESDTIKSKYEDILTKGENSSEHTVQVSDGNKITVGYRLSDDGRTLSELKAYETASGAPLT